MIENLLLIIFNVSYLFIQGVSKKLSFSELSISRFVTNIISISFQLEARSPKAQFGKTQFFKTLFIFLFSFLFQWKNDKSRWGTFSGLYRYTTTWPTRGWRTKTSTLKMRSQPSSFHWRSTKIYLWSWQIHTVLKLINLVFWPSVLKLYTLTQGDLIAVGTKKGQLWLLNESSLQPIRPQPFTYSKVGWRPIIIVFNFRDVSHNCK